MPIIASYYHIRKMLRYHLFLFRIIIFKVQNTTLENHVKATIFEFAKFCAFRAYVPTCFKCFTCLRTSKLYVSTCLHVYVP